MVNLLLLAIVLSVLPLLAIVLSVLPLLAIVQVLRNGSSSFSTGGTHKMTVKGSFSTILILYLRCKLTRKSLSEFVIY
jgi:hypothetical protein